jgi:hypothetical protein
MQWVLQCIIKFLCKFWCKIKIHKIDLSLDVMVNNNIFWNKYYIKLCNIDFFWVRYYAMANLNLFFIFQYCEFWNLDKFSHILVIFVYDLHIQNEMLNLFQFYLNHNVNIHLKTIQIGTFAQRFIWMNIFFKLIENK